MRINHTNRILMNEADGSPGGGAAPATPAAPIAAPTAPETPALTAEAVATIVATAVDTKLKAFENGLFANARKAGLLGKEKSAETPSVSSAAAAPASTGLSADEVEALIEQTRVLTKVQLENKLSDAAVLRMKSALKADKPNDVSTWTASYLADLGLVRTSQESSTPTTSAPAVAIAPNTAPISDRGSPAPTGAVGWRHELQMAGALGMSKAGREQMDAELGAEVARKQRLALANTQLARMQVHVKPQ
jgi:hypothetical protein